MSYLVAEKFRSVQGEGVWTGTPMAFIRFVGCSVGKKICNACDTDFERAHSWRGGGAFSTTELAAWADCPHVCLTGGEPLDQDLDPLFRELQARRVGNGGHVERIHIETSGTKLLPHWMQAYQSTWAPLPRLWICVSPKPGYQQQSLEQADELKIIVPGLGVGEGWPTLEDALAWVERFPGKPVFLQPRNKRDEIDPVNLALCEQLVLEHPQLRLSVQLHKILKVR